MGEIKYRSDSEMKDSGVEWLGQIPENWDLSKLSFFVEVKDGTHDTPKYVDKDTNTYPLITSKNVEENKLNLVDVNYISEKNYLNIEKRSGVEYGDIIMPMIGTVGNSCIVNTYEKFAIKNVALFKKNKRFYNKYLFYLLESELVKNQFNLLTRGGVQNFVSLSILRNLKVPNIKNKNEQQKIASFLDIKTSELDRVTAKKEELIEKLEEAKKSLISEVVTGKVKIVDGKLVDRSESEMKDSGVEWLGMIPQDWNTTKIKFISKLNEHTLSNDINPETEVNYIDIGSVDNNGNINGVEKLNFSDAPSRARRIVNKSDVIISTVRTYLKAISYISSEYNQYICSTGFAVITPNVELLISKYFYYVIQSSKYVDQIVSRSVGVSYPAINGSEIIDLKFALPNIKEQKIMMKLLKNKINSLNLYSDKNKIQIQKLKQAKQSLISQAVTGKIDLRDWKIKDHKDQV